MASYNDIVKNEQWSSFPVTYTFSSAVFTSNAVYYETFEGESNVRDGSELANANDAMFAWSNVSTVSFAPASSPQGAQLLLLEGNLDGNKLGSTLPFYESGTNYAVNIVIVNRDPSAYNFSSHDPFATYLHEIGHALGLQHPNGGSGSTSGFNTDLTIMSYNPGAAGSPVGPMAYDIAAIQAKYGANFAYNAGGTLYDVTTDSVKDASTIWDGGGNDTLDASAAGSSVTLDLRAPIDLDEKYMSDAAGKQFFVAYGANIENAIGSAYADTLIGNDDYAAGFYAHLSSLSFDGANRLEGRGGNDILIGGGGADTLDGGDDIDWVSYAGKDEGVMLTLAGSASTRGEIVALSGSGSGGDAEGDQLMIVEVIEGSDGNDTIQLTNTGKESANTILGGLGDDTIIGNEAFFSGGVTALLQNMRHVETMIFAGS